MTCDKCKAISLNSYTSVTTVEVVDGRKVGKEQVTVCPRCGVLILRYLNRTVNGK